MMLRMGSLLAMLVSLLTACATLSAGDGEVERPLSDRTPATELERRARSHVELGLAYFDLGRIDVALDEARSALNELPNYAPAHHLIGLAYMIIGETAPARDNFERALRVAPGDPDFNNSYGWFQCTQGSEEEGLARLARAARNPYYRHQTRAYTNMGFCHLRTNDVAAAEKDFARALEVDPQNGSALFQSAELSYRRGQYEAAGAMLARLHQVMDPNAPSVWLGLRAARRAGQRDAEASDAAQLRSRFADAPEYQLMMQGKYE